MNPDRKSLILAWVFALGLASGCSEKPPPTRELVPFLTESGTMTYRFADELPPLPSRKTSVADSSNPPIPMLSANERAYQETQEFRRKQKEEIEQSLRNRLDEQEVHDRQRLQQQAQSRAEQHERFQSQRGNFLDRRKAHQRELSIRESLRVQQDLEHSQMFLRQLPR